MAQRAIPEPKKIRWKRIALQLLAVFLFGIVSFHLRHRTWAYSGVRAALVTLAFLLLFALMQVVGRLGLKRLRRLQDEGDGTPPRAAQWSWRRRMTLIAIGLFVGFVVVSLGAAISRGSGFDAVIGTTVGAALGAGLFWLGHRKLDD